MNYRRPVKRQSGSSSATGLSSTTPSPTNSSPTNSGSTSLPSSSTSPSSTFNPSSSSAMSSSPAVSTPVSVSSSDSAPSPPPASPSSTPPPTSPPPSSTAPSSVPPTSSASTPPTSSSPSSSPTSSSTPPTSSQTFSSPTSPSSSPTSPPPTSSQPTSSSSPSSPPPTSSAPTSSSTPPPPSSSTPPPSSSASSSSPSPSQSPSDSSTSSSSSSSDTPSSSSDVGSSSSPARSSETATTTFPSTVFVATTNSLGQSTSFAPPEITSTFTSTLSNGGVITVTQVVANPTLSPNDRSGSGSRFFHNKGAVAGVFLIVGLAAASIVLWILFSLRRRRRTRKLEHDTAVSATLAAAGFNRSPIDGDDDDGQKDGEMAQRSGFASFSTQPTSHGQSELPTDEELGVTGGFDPYVGYGPVAGPGPSSQGYIPARTSSPPADGGFGKHVSDSYGSGNGNRSAGPSHSGHHQSAGSYEPLLAGMADTPSPSAEMGGIVPPPTPPPKNPARAATHEGARGDAESGYESDGDDATPDDRLDPGLGARLKGGEGKTRSQELRDDVDYSRPVLEVRNLPDGARTPDE